MSDLIERLRRRSEIMEALGDTTVELKGAWVLESQLTLAQGAKDNAEAADRITALEKENERFRGALTAIAEAWDETDEWDGTNKFNASRDVARTALRDAGGGE